MRDARARHGRAILIDWHSMPAQTAGGAGGADVVLGDRYGTSCSVQLTRRLRTLFEGLGWRVALNQPYPGGYSTQLWGQPADGLEAVQIELSRALYLDETTRQPGPGWSRCVSGLRQVIAGLCARTRGRGIEVYREETPKLGKTPGGVTGKLGCSAQIVKGSSRTCDHALLRQTHPGRGPAGTPLVQESTSDGAYFSSSNRRAVRTARAAGEPACRQINRAKADATPAASHHGPNSQAAAARAK